MTPNDGGPKDPFPIEPGDRYVRAVMRFVIFAIFLFIVTAADLIGWGIYNIVQGTNP